MSAGPVMVTKEKEEEAAAAAAVLHSIVFCFQSAFSHTAEGQEATLARRGRLWCYNPSKGSERVSERERERERERASERERDWRTRLVSPQHVYPV